MVNKVLLIGNVGGEPEVRQLPSGNWVANVTLATSESWKDRQTGERQERTEWHRLVFFGRLAEVVGQYVRKGSKLYVEGRLQTREWEKDGVKRYTTEIVIDQRGQMQMLDRRPNEGQYQQAPAQQQYQQQAPAQQQYQQAPPQQQQAPAQQQSAPPPQQPPQQQSAPPAQQQQAPAQTTSSQNYAQASGGGRQSRPAPAQGTNGNAPGYNPFNANQAQPAQHQQQAQQHQAPVAQMPPEYDGGGGFDDDIPFAKIPYLAGI